MVKPWIANDKIENSGEIFSRLGNVTKLKDWCGHSVMTGVTKFFHSQS